MNDDERLEAIKARLGAPSPCTVHLADARWLVERLDAQRARADRLAAALEAVLDEAPNWADTDLSVDEWDTAVAARAAMAAPAEGEAADAAI